MTNQAALFHYRVRTDFGMPAWPKHPSAGKRAEIRGPMRLHDGRTMPGHALVWVSDGYGERHMSIDDIEEVTSK